LGARPTSAELPDSILQHVIRTRESVILDDACAENLFSEDEYIRYQRPRSVLCLALVKQATLIGVLYLENKLASHVFTPARYSVLNLLSSQAAISLENARLYTELTTENRERRRTDEALRREVLERERAEQLARMDEMRFRRFFDLPLIGMAVTSPARRFLEVNDKLCEILGYSREELIGRDWASITHPDDLSGNLDLLDEAMGGATESYSMDKRYIHRDGQIVHVSISVCCVRRVDGTADHFVLTVQDVTARYQVQEQLQLTEAHLKHAQHIAQIASYEAYPPEFFSTGWSEEFRDICGLKPGDPVPGREEFIERFVHPDDREHVRKAFQMRGTADRRSMFEYRVVRPDGALRYLQSVADTVKDKNGRIVQLVGTILDVTERKLATERLETQTALLDRLFQSVAEATVLLDLDDRVLRVNTEFTRMFGYTDEQATGLRINDLIVPPEKIAEAVLLSAKLAQGELCNAETVRRREDGSCLQVSILGAPIVSGGRQIASYAIYRDITERKRVEEALRESRERYAVAVDGAMDGIWDWDLVTGMFYRAPRNQQITMGRPSDGIDVRHADEWSQWFQLHPDDVSKRDVAIRLHLEGRTPHYEIEYRVRHQDGAYHWVHARGVCIRDASGRAIRFAGSTSDIDARKAAEEALRASEQRFRDYAASASDWLWETGPDHRFTWFSPRITDVDQPNYQIGKVRWEVAADVDEEPEKWRLHRATLDAHEPFRGFTYRAVQADGSIAYLAVSGRPVIDAQGRFQGYRGAASDVTLSVRADQAEKALHRTQAELAHVARVTTLGELAASIAHEINQPLAAIVADAYAALNWLDRSGAKLENVREALTGIVSDGDRAAQVVTRIRALLSRSPIERAPCDLGKVVSDAALLVGAELRRHGIVLEMLMQAQLPKVMADRVQLQQVVLNLLMNAIEAMREVPRERRLLIARSLVEQRDDGPLAVVEVEDAGVGFRGSQARLFDAFYTTKPGGLGMGLSISRSIIERHGGRLWATANPEHGATFHFALPGIT
ncbi:MAG: hypothetical protein C5B46_08070, partial [Proteobacteria bacterium]